MSHVSDEPSAIIGWMKDDQLWTSNAQITSVVFMLLPLMLNMLQTYVDVFPEACFLEAHVMHQPCLRLNPLYVNVNDGTCV